MKHHDNTTDKRKTNDSNDDDQGRSREREMSLSLKPKPTDHKKYEKIKQSTKPRHRQIIEDLRKRQVANMMLDIQAAVAFLSRIFLKQPPNQTHHPMTPRHVNSASGPLASLKTKVHQMHKDNQHTSRPTARVVTPHDPQSPALRNADKFNRIQPGVPILDPFMRLLLRYRDGMQARLFRAKKQAEALTNKKQAETQLAEQPMSTHLPDSPTLPFKIRPKPQ